MGKLAALTLAFLLPISAVAQQIKVSQLPVATTPLSGSELFYVVQGGISKNVAFSAFSQSLLPQNNTWTGVNTYTQPIVGHATLDLPLTGGTLTGSLTLPGGTFTGPLALPAASGAAAPLVFTLGSAPSGTPPNGDAWFTSAGLFYQVGGATVGPLVGASQIVAPQPAVLTTGTALTYTTPTVNGALPLYLDVTDMCGAGSGGGGSGSGSPGVGAAGGATTFGSLTANGGPVTPANTSATYPTPATATGGDTSVQGGLGGTVNIVGSVASVASSGASSPLGFGGSGGGVNTGGDVAAGNATGYCAGGGAGGFGSSASYNSGWGGNAGAYLKAVITSPAATYTYTIGAAGSGGAAGTGGAVGGAGSGGFIRVVAHWQ